MRTSMTAKTGIALALLGGLAAGACAQLAGLEEADEFLKDGDATPTECTERTLPDEGDVNVRVGSMFPSDRRFDFCIKPSGTDWAGVTPVLDGGTGLDGERCTSGLVYKDLTIPFGVGASGSYDVKVVESGATCTESGLVEEQAFIDSGRTSLVFFGESSSPRLAVRPESRGSSNINGRLGFLHALRGAGPLSLYWEDVEQQLFDATTFGERPSDGDENGYVQISAVPLSTVSLRENDEVIATAGVNNSGGDSYSAYAIGEKGNKSYPPELYFCDENDPPAAGVFAKCGGDTFDLRVMTYNTRLIGSFEPYHFERSEPIIEALANYDADIICVNEVWPKDLRDRLIAAAAASGKYPHHARVTTDPTTPATDPFNVKGEMEPAPTEPPCAGLEDTVNDGLSCVDEFCTQERDGKRIPINGDIGVFAVCAAENCISKVGDLISNPDKQACWSAVFAGLVSLIPMSEVEETVTTDPYGRYAFDGGNSTVLLSKHPIRNSEQYVFAHTEWKQVGVRAEVELPTSSLVDVYCIDLTNPADDPLRPYTGFYGDKPNGEPAESRGEAWRNEHLLTINQLIDWVNTASPNRKAIVAGEFYAGSEVPGVLAAYTPENVPFLEAAFPLALPPGQTPECTLCAENPLAGLDTASSQPDSIRLHNMAITDVREQRIVLKENALELPLSGEPTQVPLSLYYGIESVVRVGRGAKGDPSSAAGGAGGSSGSGGMGGSGAMGGAGAAGGSGAMGGSGAVAGTGGTGGAGTGGTGGTN